MENSFVKQALEEIANLFYTGQIGDANSRYAQILAQLDPASFTNTPASRRDFMQALQEIFRCQKEEDWVGLADILRYKLSKLG